MNMKLSAAGFALQTAKGAAAAQPAFFGPVGGGNLVGFEVEQVEDELTSATVGGVGEFRQSVAVAADYESRAWPHSIGGLLYAALGAIASTAGTPAVPAVLTTALAGSNNDLTFLAVTAGVDGNSITVALVDPSANNAALSVDVLASAISVNLATGPAGEIVSTAAQVKAAINADAEAAALVTAAIAPGNTGWGVVTAMAAANLAGGADATGSGFSTHVITPDADLPWVTVFGSKDTERKAASDCKLDELKLEWEGNGPLKVTVTWAGLDATWSDIAFVPVLDETLVTYFKGIGLTAAIDLDGNGEDCGAAVLGGSVNIKRNLEGDAVSGQLLPFMVNEGDFEATIELKVRVEDLSAVRLVLTGTVDGTAISEEPLYGGVTLTFADSGINSVKFEATRVPWKTSEPDADPKGGPAELTLQGTCYGNPALTATVVNDRVSY